MLTSVSVAGKQLALQTDQVDQAAGEYESREEHDGFKVAVACNN